MYENSRKKVVWTVVASATMLLWVMSIKGIEAPLSSIAAFAWTIILIILTIDWYAQESKPKRRDGN